MKRCRCVALALGVSCAGTSGGPGGAMSPTEASSEAAGSGRAQQAAGERKPTPVTPEIPDTPAGRTLRAWLDVLNTGDEARILAFASEYAISPDILNLVDLRRETGGFKLLAVAKSSRLEIVFLLQQKGSAAKALGWFKVEDAQPAVIAQLGLRVASPDTNVADLRVDVDAATRKRVIDGIAEKLEELYVYPELAQKMQKALRELQERGELAAVDNGLALSEVLTEWLQGVSKDRHLRVNFAAGMVPDTNAEPSVEDRERRRQQLERVNCGFERSERLDGNIGYVKFNLFGEEEFCASMATTALGSLGDVDALILDVRDNSGGQPEMVAFVASYLFGERTHLNDIYDRHENKTTEYFTRPDVPGTKFIEQPVYVLTSHRTFSAAEELCYDLQNLKRATIVGETTGGGAHPAKWVRLDDHFAIRVPYARAVNPVTKTNWEGTGILPDVRTSADDALVVARRLAAEHIQQTTRDTP